MYSHQHLANTKRLFMVNPIKHLRCKSMTDWVADWAFILLILEGIPLMGFMYYLDHKKKMHLLEMGITKEDDPLEIRLERRLISGLFLSFSGASLIVSPSIAGIAGLEAGLTFELLVIGIVILCSGMAMLLGYGILKGRNPYSSSESAVEFK